VAEGVTTKKRKVTGKERKSRGEEKIVRGREASHSKRNRSGGAQGG